jgi:hypothetical protein
MTLRSKPCELKRWIRRSTARRGSITAIEFLPLLGDFQKPMAAEKPSPERGRVAWRMGNVIVGNGKI